MPSSDRLGQTRSSQQLRRLRFLGVMGLSALIACMPALNWRELRPDGSGIQLQMPCKPSTFARPLQLQSVALDWNLLACSAGEQTWSLAWGDLKDPALVTSALLALRAVAQRNLAAPAAHALPWAPPGSTPNAESARVQLQGRLPDGRPAAQDLAVFARGTVVYQASVIGAQALPEAAALYFASLRVW